MCDGWVIRRCEQKGEARILELRHRAVHVEIQGDIQCLKNIRGTGTRRYRTVAAFDYFRSPSGGHQRRRGGNVDGVGAVAAGTCGVQQTSTGNRERARGIDECLGGAGDVREGLTAGADRRQERGDVHVFVLTDGQRLEHRAGLLDCGVMIVQIRQQ